MVHNVLYETHPVPDRGHKLAAVLMVKDEEARILETLESVIGVVNAIIVLDTGSTDKTKEKIFDFCKEKKVPLYLAEEPFVDFSSSRNTLLDYAEDKADYLLQL